MMESASFFVRTSLQLSYHAPRRLAGRGRATFALRYFCWCGKDFSFLFPLLSHCPSVDHWVLHGSDHFPMPIAVKTIRCYRQSFAQLIEDSSDEGISLAGAKGSRHDRVGAQFQCGRDVYRTSRKRNGHGIPLFAQRCRPGTVKPSVWSKWVKDCFYSFVAAIHRFRNRVPIGPGTEQVQWEEYTVGSQLRMTFTWQTKSKISRQRRTAARASIDGGKFSIDGRSPSPSESRNDTRQAARDGCKTGTRNNSFLWRGSSHPASSENDSLPACERKTVRARLQSWAGAKILWCVS